MITRIEARRFRSLKAVDQNVGAFSVLVGPNGSGKSSFLDVVALLSDLVRNRGDVRQTVYSRSSNFTDLLWLRNGRSFELAVEAEIPKRVAESMGFSRHRFTMVRYEIAIGLDDSNEIGIDHETLWLSEPESRAQTLRLVFPQPLYLPPSLLVRPAKRRRTAFKKGRDRNDNYYPEGRKSYVPSFKLGRGKAALAHVPADPEVYPVSLWFQDLLEKGVESFVLNGQMIRQPSPPGSGRRFIPDGSNLPWVVDALRTNDSRRFAAWLAHVKTALDDVADIQTVERPEDRHRYIVVEYANGARVPSWLVSDGTLRLLALTIPAYLPDIRGTFLVEEPENGIHPRAIESVIQSLSSVYGGQVLVATHSPIALNMVEPKDVLCFAKDETGATDIVSGDDHPALTNWKEGEPDFGVLFAAGILS